MSGRSVAAAGLTAVMLVMLAGAVDGLGGPLGPEGRAGLGPAPDHALHALPDWVGFGGITLGRHVFLKRSQQTPFGLEHELVHVRQQAEQPAWFWVSYLLLPRWRLRWEAEAYAVHARARCPIDGEHGLAAYLSGPAYLWPASQARAAAAIRGFL